jgi:hypothetical protein
MTFGAKPMGPPPIRPRPQSRGEVAFAIGSRAIITPTGTATSQVQLLDEDGMPIDQRLPVDVQVMITAWRPRRSAPPRYRVCSTDQIEGWIDAANLRRPPPPPPPAPMAITGPPKPPPKPVGKAAAKRAGAAKPVAKPAVPAPVTAKGAVLPKVAAKAGTVLAPKVVAKPAPAPAAKPKAVAKVAPSASRGRTARTSSAAAARSRAPKPPAKPKGSRPASKRAR